MTLLTDLLNTFSSRGEKNVFIYRTGIRRFVYSYKWLFDNALRMASWLEKQGINKGDRVVVWAPNSPWWGVVFWGCVARGAIVVPVDFMSGKERAEKIATLTEATLIIQSQYKIDKFTNDETPIINIEELEYLVENFSTAIKINNPEPNDIAELIYTSGTTGDPKGVILTHKNLISNLLQINKHIPVVGPEWNFLSVLPLSHTFEQMVGFLTPLYKGGKVVYLRTLKPSALMEAFTEEDIYVVPIVPRLLQALKTSIERELKAKHLLSFFSWLSTYFKLKPLDKKRKWFFPIQKKFGRHFKFFVSGGAALPKDTAEFWNGMGFCIIEGYGITECSPVLAVNSFEKQIIGSVGKSLGDVEIRIENNEILAKGPNVFPGYYQNEEATKKSFTSEGFFKTGDNGYFDEKGNLHIKGRQKEMIVTGAGINVYPDDIEPLLNAITGVREACVVGKHTKDGEEVHAVLLLAEIYGNTSPSSSPYQGEDRGGVVSLEEQAKRIVEEANAKLDSLQQIGGFTIWPEKEFPKTPTMKIQKFKVKEKVQTMGEGNASIGESQSDKLIEIISRVTGKLVKEISDSSILVSDLGLTSIARLELVNTLEQEFRLDLEDTAITQTTSVGELRKMIEKREKYKGNNKPRKWADSIPVKIVRLFADYLFHIPLLKMIISLDKKGLENFKDIKGPAIFIANHTSYFDPYVILWSLPPSFRYWIAPAAGDFLFFNKKSTIEAIAGRLMYEYVSFFSMALLVGEQFAFRTTLLHMGKVIDRGRHIFIFPEGERAWDGKLLPFQPGLGIMVKELKVPIVPIKISGLHEIWPRGKFIQRRGSAKIVFGKPMTFTNELPDEILKKARQAIEEL